PSSSPKARAPPSSPPSIVDDAAVRPGLAVEKRFRVVWENAHFLALSLVLRARGRSPRGASTALRAQGDPHSERRPVPRGVGGADPPGWGSHRSVSAL